MTNRTNGGQMRAGFTMIELIFVIVIIGILAAVAIPRLAATRDDAKLGACATEVTTALSDLSAYYTSQGSFATNPKDMTNVVLSGTISGSTDANGTKYTGTLNYKCQDLSKEAVIFKMASVANPGAAGYEHNLTVSAGTSTDPLDKQLVQRLTAKNVIGSKIIGGKRVVY